LRCDAAAAPPSLTHVVDEHGPVEQTQVETQSQHALDGVEGNAQLKRKTKEKQRKK
jgi:hypothetical protein